MDKETRIYYEDLIIAKSLILQDKSVINDFYYKGCYPLFKALFDSYYTDCDNCYEFMNEIYLLILTPSKKTGKCQLENYRGESTLRSWIKTVALYYCYKRFDMKNRLPIDSYDNNFDKKDSVTDSFFRKTASTEDINLSNLNKADMVTLVSLMPNKRYGELIRLRYIEQKTNEETAQIMGMTMANYYNKHKLAQEQFKIVCRKEESYV